MEISDSINEALGLIDEQLGRVQSREIISATEVSDLLLDSGPRRLLCSHNT